MAKILGSLYNKACTLVLSSTRSHAVVQFERNPDTKCVKNPPKCVERLRNGYDVSGKKKKNDLESVRAIDDARSALGRR